jgi:hypothetical protein
LRNHPRNCRTCRRVRKRGEQEYASPQPIRKGSVRYRRVPRFVPVLSDEEWDAWMYKIQLGDALRDSPRSSEPCLPEDPDVPA